MAFCPNCGNQVSDTEKFCAVCGAAVGGATPNPTVTQTQDTNPNPSFNPNPNPNPGFSPNPNQSFSPNPNPNFDPNPNPNFNPGSGSGMDKRKIGAITVAVVVVLLLLIIMPGRGYKATAKKFAKALENGDAKTIVNLIPKDAVKRAINENDFKNKKELIEELEDSMPDFSETDLKLSIEEYNKCDKGELSDIKERYEDNDLKKPSNAKIVTYSAEIDGEENDDTMDITLVKIGKNWYIDVFSASFL